MVLEGTWTSLFTWIFCALIPCLLMVAKATWAPWFYQPAGRQLVPFWFDCVQYIHEGVVWDRSLLYLRVNASRGQTPRSDDPGARVPAPQNLSVHSANMNHRLTWSPVTVSGDAAVRYWVEYQGEYESLYMSHIWIPSRWCSPTPGPECDVTDDITATVPYGLRVRATAGPETSAWSALKQPFNRNSTRLTPPRMAVTKDGSHLVLELEDLGPQCEFFVVYWRNEPGAKEHAKVVRGAGLPVHLGAMEPGAAYCVKARTRVTVISRHSAFGQAQCVEAQGEPLPLALALFAFLAFVLFLVALPFSVWKMGQLLRYSCCPMASLPDTLKITNPSRKLVACRREEEVDACVLAVLSPEEVFGAWI